MSSFLQWMLMGLVSAVHPFFISMTDINHNAASKSLEVSVRIFSDDFEKTLKANCKCKVELLTPTDKRAMDKIVNTYVTRHLLIMLDGKPATLEFAGYQPEEGSIWSYFEIKNVPSFSKIDITNSLLYDYKNEQVNMVHIKANGKEKSDKLDYPEKNLAFTF